MITNLNEKVEAQKPTMDFTPIPEGRYKVKVTKIKPWEAKKKNIMVNQKDENGYLAKDDKGKIIKKLYNDFTFYIAPITFEVTDGEYASKLVSSSLTTHPNADFITKNFLYAIGVSEISTGEIPNKCVGYNLEIDVSLETYEKKYVDDTTGLEKTETKTKNDVKGFYRITDLGL